MTPNGLMLAYFVVLGLAIGSFLNVVISRLPAGESIVRPRSRCPCCRHPIAWYDNIPLLSFVLLIGRCRYCKKPISFRYPTVELIMGVLSATFWLHFGHSWDFLFWLLLSAVLVTTIFLSLSFLIEKNKS